VDLDALGNIGEFLGSVGVLVSLVYLAIQIRKSTETERTATYRSIVSDFGRLNESLASDPELLSLFARGMEDFDVLEAEQKARISQIFYVLFRSFENMYYQHRMGYLDEEIWTGWKRLSLAYFKRPGFQLWWSIRRDVFSESFVEFLETTELDRPIASYADVMHLHPPAAPPPSGSG
jgi:hypothetical protein